MNSVVIPHTINEAEVAVYYADKYGYPVQVARDGYKDMAPIGSCKTSVSILKNVSRGSVIDLYGVSPMALSGLDEYEIKIAEAYSSWLDGGVLTDASIDSSSYLIIVVRFFDAETGVWQKLQFYYGSLISDGIEGGEDIVGRSTSFSASWLEKESFNISDRVLPAMDPTVVGRVEYSSQGIIQAAYNYNFKDELWVEQPGNSVQVNGSALKYVSLTNTSDGFVFSVLIPNQTYTSSVGKLNKPSLSFSSVEVLKVRNHLSTVHHGLEMSIGMVLKRDFSPDPLLLNSDQPMVIFRILNKVYATYHDGVFSIPCLVEGPAVNMERGYFRFTDGAVDNPASSYRGLTLSDKCGYIDGTLKV